MSSSSSFRQGVVTLACPGPHGADVVAALPHMLQPTSELTGGCGAPVHVDSSQCQCLHLPASLPEDFLQQ